METPEATQSSYSGEEKSFDVWKIIGVFGVIGTFVFGFLGIYFYFQSVEKREPILVADPVRTEIVSSERTSEAPIRVLRSDSTEVEGDVTSVRYYFWNNGRKAIKPKHVLEPVQITIENESARIMDFKLIEVSRDVTGIDVSRSENNPDRSLIFSFEILEQDDGASIQIIYEGSPKASFLTSGIVEGAGEIKNEPPSSLLWLGWGIFILICASIAFFMLGKLDQKDFEKYKAKHDLADDDITPRRRLRAMRLRTLALYMLVGILALAAVAFGPKRPLDEKKELIQSVPFEIHQMQN